MTGAGMGRHSRTITYFWENIYIPSGLNGTSMFSQYTKHPMTTVDKSGHHRSRAPVQFLECVTVLMVDPDHVAEPVHDQISGLDPPSDLALGGLVASGELRDGREFRGLVALVIAAHAGSSGLDEPAARRRRASVARVTSRAAMRASNRASFANAYAGCPGLLGGLFEGSLFTASAR